MACSNKPYKISNCDGPVCSINTEVLVYPLSEKTKILSSIYPVRNLIFRKAYSEYFEKAFIFGRMPNDVFFNIVLPDLISRHM